ncbi:MAG: alpha/beta fold hydrolase [Alphaproteobacteria bacterium]
MGGLVFLMIRRCLLLLVVAIALSGCTGFFFQPMKDYVVDPAKLGFTYEDVAFAAEDGTRLHGWFFQADGARIGSVLFLHGNAENISTHFANVAWLTRGGFDVFAIDYRGYGRSAGVPTLDGLHQDVTAALDTLLKRPGVRPEEVVVFGQSLGGAVALTAIAANPEKDRLAGLVVEGAFSSYRGIAREKLGDFWLTWPFQWPISLTIDGRYDPLAAAAALSPLPLLIVQGQADQVVPPHHGEALYQAAAEPKAIWRPEAAGHIAAFANLAMQKRLQDYLTTLVDARE